MILKARDSDMAVARFLEAELARARSDAQREVVERELLRVRAELHEQAEATARIDFHFAESSRWFVIHDLRLEGGCALHFEHLVISASCDVYVVDSSNFKRKVRYRGGAWERMEGDRWSALPCPIEQNRRRVALLKEIINRSNLLPDRDDAARLKFHNIVVLNPSCSIGGKLPADVDVWRMDHMPRELREPDHDMASDRPKVAPGSAERFARALLEWHRPLPYEATAPAKRVPLKRKFAKSNGHTVAA